MDIRAIIQVMYKTARPQANQRTYLQSKQPTYFAQGGNGDGQ